MGQEESIMKLNKLTPAQAIEHLKKVEELIEYQMGGRDDAPSKEIIKNNKLVEELILELAQDKYADRKRFRRKMLDVFGKQKDELTQENKELKIELQQEKEKHD